MCQVLDIVEEKGHTKGVNDFALLITRLIAEGRTEDVELAAKNEDDRNRFFKEFGLDI